MDFRICKKNYITSLNEFENCHFRLIKTPATLYVVMLSGWIIRKWRSFILNASTISQV